MVLGGSSNFEDDVRIEGGDIQHGMLTSPAPKKSLQTFFPHPNKHGDIIMVGFALIGPSISTYCYVHRRYCLLLIVLVSIFKPSTSTNKPFPGKSFNHFIEEKSDTQ